MNHSQQKSLFTIVRHGETELNVRKIVMGTSDSPLTAQGIQQLENLTKTLSTVSFDACYSSDLSRAMNSAEILVRNRQLSIVPFSLFRERNFGSLDGQPFTALLHAAQAYAAAHPELSPEEKWRLPMQEGIESHYEVEERFARGLHEISEKHLGEHILVVTHGGCMRAFLVRANYFSIVQIRSFGFANCGFISATYDGKDFAVQDVQGLERLGQDESRK